jgi:hypothetical protein
MRQGNEPGEKALTIADLNDRILAKRRSLRRRLWLALAPGVTATVWFAGIAIAGVGAPSILLGVAVGVLCWKELKKRRSELLELEDLEDRLEDASSG